MKKLSLSIVSLLLLSSVFSQTPITLTFQAKDSLTQASLVLDSVLVTNLAENCDTTLYRPVSVFNLLVLKPHGIEDPTSGISESFILMQNIPNPFQGSTLVRIYQKNVGELNLAVYDNSGKRLSEFHNRLAKGWHLFGISTRGTQQLLLKVSDNFTTKTIKMISTAPGNEGDLISYKGQAGQGTTLKSAPDSTEFIYYQGNQLQYTGYVNGYQKNILLDNPLSSQTYTFKMVQPVFSCGSSITINHVAGAVAPVNKTVTYGTVNNVTGEPAKCWITSNLGADHQATALLTDATEASAGWYWQFNRKQGYKHDGATLTPSWTITSISENSDWLIENDPCKLELGQPWHMPTYTEWFNVDNSGGWSNWYGPWNSGLKLHGAGYLNYSDGALLNRGSYGVYWTGMQSVMTSGSYLYFYLGACEMGSGNKAGGFSVRCLRD